MRRFNKYEFEEDSSMEENRDPRYSAAYKQVKRIKGFYTHLLVYILVNAFLICRGVIFKDTQEFWRWETFSTAIFWGIGLTAHGLSVFGKNILFGSGGEHSRINYFVEL